MATALKLDELEDKVLEALPIGIALLDADHVILHCNTAFTAALGLRVGSAASPDRIDVACRAAEGQHRQVTVSGHVMPAGGAVVCAIVAETPATAALPEVTDPTGPALDTLQIGLGGFAADGTLMFGNPRLAELLRIRPESVQPGVSFSTLLFEMAQATGFAAPEGVRFLASQAKRGRGMRSVDRHVFPEGRAIEIATAPLPGGGWTMAVADVSSLAQAEDDARQRAASLDAILAAIPHGICVYSADNRVTMFNPAYNQVMDGAPVQFGDRLADVIRRRADAGEYGEGCPEDLAAQQLSYVRIQPQTRQRRRPNGTVIDVRTAPLPDGGHVAVVTDVTPLVRAEAEVTRRAADMEVMLGSIRHGVLFWNADRRLIASNEIAANLLGHPPDLLVPGRTQQEILAHILARGEWGEDEQGLTMLDQLSVRDHAQTYRRYLHTRAGRVLDARSDPAPGGGWISTFTDVTESVQVEEELRRAKEAAEAANQAKSRFLATMSHELRTPLNAVIGFSDALLREGRQPAPARVAEFAQQINDAGRQLLGLINIILDVARIESGRFDLAVDRVDVGALIRDAIRSTDAAAQAAEIALLYELPDGLPVLRGDERRLQQILAHLLSNAIKFTDAGGTVTVGATVEASRNLLIYVRDTGIGIPEDDIERVFEPFTQLDSTLARRFQGAGIGLYVARALVLGHGGRLTLKSQPGVGTTAEVRLPASALI